MISYYSFCYFLIKSILAFYTWSFFFYESSELDFSFWIKAIFWISACLATLSFLSFISNSACFFDSSISNCYCFFFSASISAFCLAAASASIFLLISALAAKSLATLSALTLASACSLAFFSLCSLLVASFFCLWRMSCCSWSTFSRVLSVCCSRANLLSFSKVNCFFCSTSWVSVLISYWIFKPKSLFVFSSCSFSYLTKFESLTCASS